MKRNYAIAILLASMSMSHGASANIVFDYVGNPFSFATNPLTLIFAFLGDNPAPTLGKSITASLTFSDAFDTGFTGTLFPTSSPSVSFIGGSISNSVRTINFSDADILQKIASVGFVNGNISTWEFDFSLPISPGSSNTGLELYTGNGLSVLTVDSSQDFAIFRTKYNINSPGSWTRTIVAPVPLPASLWLACAAIGALGVRRRRADR